MLLPVKWYSIPQCWRFETVQRGRKREHYQWNMDIIGEKNVSAEVRRGVDVSLCRPKLGVSWWHELPSPSPRSLMLDDDVCTCF